MIPLKDDNPTQHFPIVTILLIAANIAVYIFMLPLKGEVQKAIIFHYGFIPERFFGIEGIGLEPSGLITIITSMFLHGGLLHLGGNMLYLWIFGNNIEDIMGPFRFILFYLLCGIGGALLQGMINPASSVPMVGASGAISGVLGAYLIRFPRARVTVLFFIFFFIRLIQVPAAIVLGLWIILQLVSGIGSAVGAGGGVAFFAHIGGFAGGIILLKLFEKRRRYYGRWSPFTG